jgi:hypothetical protein
MLQCRRILFFLPVVAVSTLLLKAQAQTPAQMVRDVVYNEMHDHDHHGFWEYAIEKRGNNQLLSEDNVETKDGNLYRVLKINGRPLTPDQVRQEEERLNTLMNSASEQRRIREQHVEDESRIGRIMSMLPEAFLYDYDGTEGEVVRLNFRPNPAFNPPTTEARIFHSMGGKIWLNTKWKRLARIDGHIIQNIDFGFGILGRINKGGSFNLERVAASETDWKTRVMNVHITGRAILFKTLAKDTDEIRTGFHPIPRGTSLVQARLMVEGAGQRMEQASLTSAQGALARN